MSSEAFPQRAPTGGGDRQVQEIISPRVCSLRAVSLTVLSTAPSGYATVDYRPIDRRGEAKHRLHYSCDTEPVVVHDGDQSRV